jgi:hypothetical protein
MPRVEPDFLQNEVSFFKLCVQFPATGSECWVKVSRPLAIEVTENRCGLTAKVRRLFGI